MRRTARFILLAIVAASVSGFVALQAQSQSRGLIGVNVVLREAPTPEVLAQLSALGKVVDRIPEINALMMQATEAQLAAIAAHPAVAAATRDQPRAAIKPSVTSLGSFEGGVSTWDLDAVDVTDFGVGRTEPATGDGVYVAVLDTGLVKNWPSYFPVDRIATTLARAFGGGGGTMGTVSSQPNKWALDQDSHGTHVTSSILGFSLGGVAVNGVAPKATVIPVKVLNQNGSGWSSVIARGIVYVTELKLGVLADYPVVINMSLGGSQLDAVEKAAVDYAVANGVIIVASAGNEGEQGMGYPGAYAPVISVGAAGWLGEWQSGNSWWTRNVADPTNAADFYVTDFSSRAKTGQDLDVLAPGSWVVGPYQTNGQLGYYFLGGTSMASPHVAGLVALMAELDPPLTAAAAEQKLVDSAIPLAAGCRTIFTSGTATTEVCWGADAVGAGLATAAVLK